MTTLNQSNAVKMLALSNILLNAGVCETVEDGLFCAHVNAIPYLGNVVHTRGFSFEVLGPGEREGELKFRLFRNPDSALGS